MRPMNVPALQLAAAFLLLCTTASCSNAGSPPSGSTSTLTISIVGTNDLHGAILPAEGRGGLALLDGFVRNLRAARAADGGAVVLLDAGDLFQGSLESNLTEGAVVISAYNALGYTAAAIGNHDFDFGPAGAASTRQAQTDDPRGALKARAAEARFPFLAANILEQASGRPIDWPNVKPSTIVDVAGCRVGLVGLTTAESLITTLPANTKGLAIAPLADTLIAQAMRLRAAGATIIAVAAHAGGTCRAFGNPLDLSSCAAEEEIFGVARDIPPGLVDAIVGGHRHQGIAHEVGGIPIIASRWRGQAFGRVDLLVDRASCRVAGHRIFPPQDVCARQDAGTGACADGSDRSDQVARYEGRPVAASEEITAILAPAAARVRPLKDRPLNAVIERPLELSSREESPLGNLVADWMRASAPAADAAITNSGGLRAALPAGPLTYGRLYELIPFDNRETLIKLTGTELRRVIEHNLKQRDSAILVSGVRARATCENRRLRVAIQRDSGAPVTDDETLTVVTSDFLASGGDEFFTPIQPVRVIGGDGPLARERLADLLTRSGARWRGGLSNVEARRITYPGTRPVSCDS